MNTDTIITVVPEKIYNPLIYRANAEFYFDGSDVRIYCIIDISSIKHLDIESISCFGQTWYSLGKTPDPKYSWILSDDNCKITLCCFPSESDIPPYTIKASVTIFCKDPEAKYQSSWSSQNSIIFDTDNQGKGIIVVPPVFYDISSVHATVKYDGSNTRQHTFKWEYHKDDSIILLHGLSSGEKYSEPTEEIVSYTVCGWRE